MNSRVHATQAFQGTDCLRFRSCDLRVGIASHTMFTFSSNRSSLSAVGALTSVCVVACANCLALEKSFLSSLSTCAFICKKRGTGHKSVCRPGCHCQCALKESVHAALHDPWAAKRPETTAAHLTLAQMHTAFGILSGALSLTGNGDSQTAPVCHPPALPLGSGV